MYLIVGYNASACLTAEKIKIGTQIICQSERNKYHILKNRYKKKDKIMKIGQICPCQLIHVENKGWMVEEIRKGNASNREKDAILLDFGHGITRFGHTPFVNMVNICKRISLR